MLRVGVTGDGVGNIVFWVGRGLLLASWVSGGYSCCYVMGGVRCKVYGWLSDWSRWCGNVVVTDRVDSRVSV